MAPPNAAPGIVLDIPAEPIETGVVDRRILWRGPNDLRPMSLCKRLGRDDLFAAELAATQLQAQPHRHVARRSADAAGRGLCIGVARVFGSPLAVPPHMAMRPACRGGEIGEARAGVGHT